MKMNYLGKAGLQVSEICLGVMTFGEHSEWGHVGSQDLAAAKQFLDTAIDAGVNFFDTADIYNYGQSEEVLGKALGKRRKDMVIATKVGFDMKEGPNSNGTSRHRIISGCEASLRRLNTDYIDLFYIHCFDPATPLDETLRALDDLVRAGKVRYIGCSNFTGWQLMKALSFADKFLMERFVALQALYNLVARELEYELLPLCREEGLAVLPWSPLAGGFLTGKYRKDQPRPQGARLSDPEDQSPFDEETGYKIIEVMDTIAERHEVTVAQVALNYLLQKKGVTSIVIGARSMQQLKDNLNSVSWQMTIDEFQQLDELSKPPKVYPYWFQNWARKDRQRH